MLDINTFLSYAVSSYKQLTGKTLLIIKNNNASNSLNNLPFPFLSHGTEISPKINFANTKALELWETTLEKFIGTESKHTAEESLQATRQQFLNEVKTNGYTTGYSGVRISSKGKRFTIENATVWNVKNNEGKTIGQAATFKTWKAVNKKGEE